MFYIGFVANIDDPKKLGRVRLKVPGIVGSTREGNLSGWADIVAPFGRKPALKVGDMVLVVAIDSGPETALLVFGQLYACPANIGSLAPGANDYGPDEHSRTDITEIDPAVGQKLIIKVKGQQTAIIVDAAENVIKLSPGPNDIILSPGGSRVAVEGDPVEVMTSDGPARGHIVSGSAPMTARKIT